MKLTRVKLRKLIYETLMLESISGKARSYSMENPKVTVHLYDPVKGVVIVIKDGEDIKRVNAEEGTKAYKNYSNEKSGVKTFGFGSGAA